MAEQLPLEQLQEVYELENEQTRTSISSGGSQSSEDSGVTSLSASNVDLGMAGAEIKAEWELQGQEDQELSSSTPPSPFKAYSEPNVSGPPVSPQSKLLDFSVLKDGAFICYSLFGLFATLGFFAPQLYIVELSKSHGVEPSMASYMLSVMAVAEIFGRLSIGVLLNKVTCRKTLVLLWCVVFLCLVLVAFTVVRDFWGLVVCCAIYGYFLGTVGSTHIPMLAEEDVVGIDKMATSVGVYVFIQSFAGLAGPPLGGRTLFGFVRWQIMLTLIAQLCPKMFFSFSPGVLVDITNNYGAAFYSCAVGMGLSAVCLALVGPVKSGMCRKRKGELAEEGEKAFQDDLLDFLEVDMAVEDSPMKKSMSGDNTCVI